MVQCTISTVNQPTHPKDPTMFKIDQFAAANEAAIEQFAYFAKLSLGNIDRKSVV